MAVSQTRKIGDIAENAVVKYCKQKRWKVVGRNFAKKWGEIDIVARDGDIIVFIEVKAATTPVPQEFKPEFHFDAKKVRNLTKAAHSYLAAKGYEDADYRIDLAAVELNEKTKNAHIRYYKNAIA